MRAHQALGQGLLDGQVPLVDVGVAELRVEAHQEERQGEDLRGSDGPRTGKGLTTPWYGLAKLGGVMKSTRTELGGEVSWRL